MKDRIFLVDDEQISNFLNKKIIESELVDVVIEDYIESKKALETLKNKSSIEFPKLLIIDLRMPVLTGLDFLEALQKSDNQKLKQLKAIILTSSLNSEDKERASKLPNVIDFMNKPLDSQKAAIIKNHLSKID
ncbi:response regulator [Chondrinema litorale]|uniref:response regulator n=1 Tax=Chondrinema litorale TaxID=2994555 RepID=UPI00254284D4|nr:response regulator [Chondrinema litorale]UZR99560.1 response regulator [Chondrinema litorale]